MRSAVATADRLLDSAILALRELPLTDVSLGAIAKQAGVPEVLLPNCSRLSAM